MFLSFGCCGGSSHGGDGALLLTRMSEELSYPDELCQGAVDVSSSGQKEAAARTQIMEEEQLLVLGRETKLLSIGGKHQQHLEEFV